MKTSQIRTERGFRRVRSDYTEGMSPVAFSGHYCDLIGGPTIPTSTSDLPEGKNLYYTESRINARIAEHGPFVKDVIAGRGISVSTTGNRYTVSTPSILMFRVDGTQVLTPTVRFYNVNTDSNGVWEVDYSKDFTEVINVDVIALSPSVITLATLTEFSDKGATGTIITIEKGIVLPQLLDKVVIKIRVEGV